MLSKRKMKHPKELFHHLILYHVGCFSFYGMKALLIAYIVTQLHLGENNGYTILGTYSALIYGLPFIGGLIADKILGNRKVNYLGKYITGGRASHTSDSFASNVFCRTCTCSLGQWFWHRSG